MYLIKWQLSVYHKTQKAMNKYLLCVYVQRKKKLSRWLIGLPPVTKLRYQATPVHS